MRCIRHAFTLIELLVVIAIIALLMAILMPALEHAKTQAQEMRCRSNLRQYGIVQSMYLNDSDGRFPSAWSSLVRNEYPVAGYQRYCRWHDPRYPADGPLWRYMPEEKVNLCPTFATLAKTMGQMHPSHVASNPIVPYYSYSMNSYLGAKRGDASGYCAVDSTGRGGVYTLGEITRSKDKVFFFAEENMWSRPGNTNVLNDNALCPDARDWFGTFHGAKRGDWNGGAANAVFVDAHVESVKSGLQTPDGVTADRSTADFGRYEKFGWPHADPPK
jgi:prepilin-type N-terminal cleavage/methylation domain-containing protein/prepilin-type processing-associated H-X9-DG protein